MAEMKSECEYMETMKTIERTVERALGLPLGSAHVSVRGIKKCVVRIPEGTEISDKARAEIYRLVEQDYGDSVSLYGFTYY